MNVYQVLTPTEVRELLTPSDIRGWMAITTTWAIIGSSLAVVAWHPAWYTVLIALILLGGRHLGLAILMHEAAHYSLFKTRWLNQWAGSWLCAYPTWQDLSRYRTHHINHHKFAGSSRDPDASLVQGYPVTRGSMARKFARDLTGISGLKRIYGLLLMDFGFIRYTVANDVVRLDQKGRKALDVFRTGARNLRGFLITNTLFFIALAGVGHSGLYALWVIAYLIPFSVFVRIRSFAEHACTEQDLDPAKSTRTTIASPLARLTVAPHRVNFHLEHHLVMTLPYFNLPKLHRILRERGALQGAHIAKNYLEVFKTVVT